ncbi:M20/M25/M40 family metallo-hydrolase [uncultured Rikenella sp.]|uniref:M28 family metallopeptidase n=1 Tax=uncultured Rikenella sp. TaxID=368003 RepID=UPI0025D0EBA8|nr:M20/M25/M40 family metallo-hydrolase [uncultured Rikenella sp.]
MKPLHTTLLCWALYGTTLATGMAAPAEASPKPRKEYRRGLEAITRRNAEASLRFLASDEMGGRLAGSVEGQIAGQYIRSELEQMGYSQQITEQPFTGRKGEALRNILVKIPGRDTTRQVIVGAHYDHEGRRDGRVFPGADDNASGVTVLLELAWAAAATRTQPEHTLILAFWDGEERGLQGSRHYVSRLGADTARIDCYINFDMVGRNTDEARPRLFRYFYTSAKPELKTWYAESVQAGGLTELEADFRPCDRTIGGSDNTPFARAGIPIAWYHTDGHPDYNTPNDTPDRINYPKLVDIARSAWYLIWRMAYVE